MLAMRRDRQAVARLSAAEGRDNELGELRRLKLPEAGSVDARAMRNLLARKPPQSRPQIVGVNPVSRFDDQPRVERQRPAPVAHEPRTVLVEIRAEDPAFVAALTSVPKPPL